MFLLILLAVWVRVGFIWICDRNKATWPPLYYFNFCYDSHHLSISSRAWTGSTGKATSTLSSLLRWRSGHPILETWRAGGNDHKWPIIKQQQQQQQQQQQHCSYSVWTPHKPSQHTHTMQQPKSLLRALLPPHKANPLFLLPDSHRSVTTP